MIYQDGQKVRIVNEDYPEGTVGRIHAKISNFEYNVSMCIGPCSWIERMDIKHLDVYQEPEWKRLVLAHFNKTDDLLKSTCTKDSK